MKLFVQHAKGDMNTFICKKLKLKETRWKKFNLENDEENGMPFILKFLNLKVKNLFKFIKYYNKCLSKINKRMEVICSYPKRTVAFDNDNCSCTFHTFVNFLKDIYYII